MVVAHSITRTEGKVIQMFDGLLQGLQHLANLTNLIGLICGSIMGILFGSIPGLSSMTAVALLLPFTYVMGVELALVTMVGVYVGAMYGGSIPAILFRTPGTSSSIMTSLDGYPLAQQGRAGEVLAVSAIGGGFGTFMSGVILLFLAPQLARIALAFGPPEYFALAVLAFSVISNIGGRNQAKALIAASMGLLVAMIGLDPLTGLERFTFGSRALLTGIDPIPALIGLFAVSEVLDQAAKYRHGTKPAIEKVSTKIPPFREFWRMKWVFGLATVIGTWIGILPGEGGTVACVMSYNEARRWSKHPEQFGAGSLEGVAAAETADNAVVGGALIPTLSLGIPGSATTALMLGAFAFQGIAPGPFLFTKHAGLVYAIILAVMLAAVMNVIIGLTTVKFFGKVLLIPYPILASVILLFCLIGSFVMRNNIMDVWVTLIFGIIGYLMSKFGFPLVAMTLGLILAPIIEPAFGRTLLMSNGNLGVLFARPISCVMIVIALVGFIFPWIKILLARLGKKPAGIAAA